MEKKNVSQTVDMLHGPLLGKIIRFAVPLGVSSILQQLFNAADTAVVGKFAGAQAMAAVGSNGAIINLIISLFVGLSVGANVVIASLMGKRETDRVPEAVHTIIAVALLAGLFLMVFGVTVTGRILVIMGCPEDVIDLAALYLKIYFAGIPFIMIYNFGSAVLRSIGDSRRPFYALLSAGVLNVILNLVFVIGLGLGVAGVGIATVLSNAVCAVMIIRFILSEKELFRFRVRDLCIRKEYLLWMMRIGIPAGLQGAVFSFSNTVIQSSVNSFGSIVVAGNAASIYFDSIGYFTVNAFVQACVTFTSQNFAAKEWDRCRKVFRLCMICAIISAALMDYMFIFTNGFWLSCFSSDPEVIEVARVRMMNVLILHWLISTYEVPAAALRGMGRSLVPALLTLFGTCGIRMIWVFAVFPHFGSYVSLVRVYPVTWVITGSMVCGTYFFVRHRVFTEQAES